MKHLFDNPKFWITIKPDFSNKVLNSNKLLLKKKVALFQMKKK